VTDPMFVQLSYVQVLVCRASWSTYSS
jgi:hypothetical protein